MHEIWRARRIAIQLALWRSVPRGTFIAIAEILLSAKINRVCGERLRLKQARERSYVELVSKVFAAAEFDIGPRRCLLTANRIEMVSELIGCNANRERVPLPVNVRLLKILGF